MEATAKELQNNELFTDLSEEESSTVSGGHYYGGYGCYRPRAYHRSYYRPVAYYYHRPRYRTVSYYRHW